MDRTATEPARYRLTSLKQRFSFLIVALLVLIVLIAGSSPTRVGDGSEYMAMTHTISHHGNLSLSPSEMDHAEKYLARLGPEFQVPLTKPALVADDQRQEFPHFWFYPALAVPFVAIADAIGTHPNYGFAVLNVLLLLAAMYVMLRRFPLPALLFAVGPLVWWVDKAHTEVFTFSLLAIAVALMDEKPSYSLIALGIASTQNPPIALLIPVFAAYMLIQNRKLIRDKAFLLGSALSIAVALLHPIYYLARLGVLTPQATSGGTNFGIPTWKEFSAVVLDLNIGIFANIVLLLPVLLVAIALISFNDWHRLISLKARFFLLSVVILLAAFAQTTNFNSGATPGMSRYGVWLLPFLLPLFRAGYDTAFSLRNRLSDMTGKFMVALALLGLIISVFQFHPKHAESYAKPTPIASFVWRHAPWMENPLPEIFFERNTELADQEVPRPTATPSCSKLLIVGGKLPADCPRPKLHNDCRRHEAICYANRTNGGYRFTKL